MRTRAKRLDSITNAVFFELETMKNELHAQGRTVVDLGIGSPDQPPAKHIRAALHDALQVPGVFGYPQTQGTHAFRNAAATFLRRQYSVEVDPQTEVMTLMGAQDGLAHLSLALIDPGDIVLVPDPGYPIYDVSVRLAGGIPYPLPLRPENGYLPDLNAIPSDIVAHAKLLLLNYPNNPVTALAPTSFFRDVVSFAKEHDLWVLHDAAYIELVFTGGPAPSFLAVPGAKDVGIEFHSLSKTFHFAGPRLAFAAGNAEMLAALGTVKSNIDYGVFTPIQAAGIAALLEDHGQIEEARQLYKKRRDAFLAPLHEAGWAIPTPDATMFLWARIPTQELSRDFTQRLLQQAHVASVPGIGFGREGEGYVRFSLVQDEQILATVATRIAHIL